MAIGKPGNRLPTTVQNNMGDVRVEKGAFGSIYLIAWDFAEECDKENCILGDKCEYTSYPQMRKKKGTFGASSKCMLQQRYLKNVIYGVVSKMNEKEEMTQENVIKLGFHIIPLYAQLFKFKMKEREMHSGDLVYVSEKGTPKVHPIYKEIREIVKTIQTVWQSIGGTQSVRRGAKSAKDIGDDSYVDAMYEVLGEEQPETEPPQEEESGSGTAMDFDQVGGVPDEKPKKKRDHSNKGKKYQKKIKRRAPKK